MFHRNVCLTVHGRRLIVERHQAGWKQAHIAAAAATSRKCVRTWILRYETEDGLITSTNSTRPHEVVASGRQAGAAEVSRAMVAAVAAKRDWVRTPAHERGAVLLAAAAVVEANAQA